VFVHVRDGLEQLVHEQLDRGGFDVRLPSANEFVHVVIHEFKHERQSSRRRVVQDLLEVDDVGVGVEPAERLDLPQGIHLLQRLEGGFHELDRVALAT